MSVENNSNGCVDPCKRGERTCMECYWSQVNDKNQWAGDGRCWNAQCLVAMEAKQ